MSHALELRDICKDFSGNRVLDHVNMHFDQGEVTAIIGHNGAGKSTIMNILDGVLQPTSGQIVLDGKEVRFSNPKQAANNGICMVHQEISLFDNLTVWENLFIHQYKAKAGLMEKKDMIDECRRRTTEMGIQVDPRAKVADLPVSTKQMIEICREIGINGRVLILDEPSSAIGREEVDNLFSFIRSLKENNNMCIIYISHRLDEITEISDRVYALSAGKLVAEKNIKDITIKDMVEIIVGNNNVQKHTRRGLAKDETILSVEGLNSKMLHNISFDLKKGEVLGLCGLVGSGRSEIMRSIFGCLHYDSGKIKDADGTILGKSPAKSIASGVVYISEDRKLEGMFLKQNVEDNIAITLYSKYKRFRTFVDKKKISDMVKKFIETLKIKVFNHKQIVQTLSGGNQQKVVIARCLSNEPHTILMDEPTRGIDISAKEEIFSIVGDLASNGCGVIFVSSDFSELLRVCDRVIYIKDGAIVGEEPVTDSLTEKEMITFIAEAGVSA